MYELTGSLLLGISLVGMFWVGYWYRGYQDKKNVKQKTFA